MDNAEAVRQLREMISDKNQRIARQERRVEKLTIEFWLADLRDQARGVLADMIVARELLEIQLQILEGDGKGGSAPTVTDVLDRSA